MTEPRIAIEHTDTSLRIHIPARGDAHVVLGLSYRIFLWLVLGFLGWFSGLRAIDFLRRYPPSTSNLWELAGNNPLPALLLLTAIITWVAWGGILSTPGFGT